MKEPNTSVLFFTAFMAVAMIGSVLLITTVRRENDSNLAKVAKRVVIQAIHQGFECHAAGRTIEACESEQRDRWHRIDAGEKNLPPFGEQR